jgi:hypothetical protein
MINSLVKLAVSPALPVRLRWAMYCCTGVLLYVARYGGPGGGYVGPNTVTLDAGFACTLPIGMGQLALHDCVTCCMS